MKLVKDCVCAESKLQHRFHPLGGAVKYVQACSRACKYGESSLHYCGSHVKLVQACLCAGNTLQRRFNRRGGAVKLMQACLSASED